MVLSKKQTMAKSYIIRKCLREGITSISVVGCICMSYTSLMKLDDDDLMKVVHDILNEVERFKSVEGANNG